MIESPLLKELEVELKGQWEAKWKAEAAAAAKAEARAEDILRFLHVRFGLVPEDMESAVLELREENKLNSLLEAAARCNSLEEFQSEL